MIGRIYPGETHSSWVIHGFIRFLTSKNSIARQLRSRFVFKILPMVNIDGVVAGNYRATFSGLDVSKCYDGKSSLNRMMPEALLLKKIAQSQQRLDYFIDVHTHPSKKSMFMYSDYVPLHSEHYLKVRVLPKLYGELTAMFRYYSTRFTDDQQNVKRIASLWKNLRVASAPKCYTIEVSCQGFIDRERRT
jgi:cytosolic carboxypeptidase protein 2/3